MRVALIRPHKEATTHWSRQASVDILFPKVLWNLEKIYTHDDRIYTSAGVSTGIDLALLIIGKDCGASSALQVAQELVVHLKRSAGQNQFSNFLNNQYQLRPDIAGLAKRIVDDPSNGWTLEFMARSSP